VLLENRQMTLLWKGDRSRLTAMIAGPDYAQKQWLSKLPGIHFEDSAGQVHRVAAESGLPWAVTVESSGDETNQTHQSLWLAGLVLLAMLLVAGTYLIARAATRELAVARLQSDFVGAVSHEFRTPLTSLRQLTEVLRDGRVASDDRRQTYYDAMVRQTERLHQLVESLLDFGRMEAGRSPYRLEPLDACAWVSSVVDQFSRENAGRGYQVDLDIKGTAATIAADAPALTNALWNLLENAVKYSPECRTVWVSAEREQHRLVVRVRDRGLGIPPEEQKEIFRKFVRGSGAKVLGIQGTGIGLAMVDHIVKAHGGEVLVESEPGAGSTFTMLLPCHES
jgi:signal transduction histidine kinase